MKIRRARASIVAALSVAALAACSATPADPDEPTSITIAIPGWQFTPNFDPQNGGFLWFLPTRPVYESLIHWDTEANEWAPWLAEKFEISDDGFTMSVTLREGISFTDGAELNAEGVVKAINATFQGPKAYFNYVYVASNPEATVTGAYTLDITTTTPMYDESLFLLELSYLPIVSPAAIDDPSLVATQPIGTGPYLVDEVVPEVSASYVRNPDYWNPDAFDFDEVTVVVMDDKVAALNALKSGQIDAAEIDYPLAAEAKASGLTINTGPAGFNFVAFLDRTGELLPALGDVRVRQALNYAIDRESIAEDLELGYGNPSSQPFDPNSNEYVEGGDDRYAYDPDRARELLAEAGYPDGFTIRLPEEVGGGSAIDYKPVLEQYLADVGVSIEWVPAADASATAEAVDSGEVDGWFTYSIYSNSIRMFSLGNNWAQQPVEDPEFRRMIDLYANGSVSEHTSVQKPLAEYVLEQAWYITVSQPQAIWATSPGIEMTVTNMPSYYPTLLAFRAAE